MARKKTKKYTLSEFKAWLDGIEEIQPTDWNPDATQWKMIRERINSIVEPPPPPKPVPAQVIQQQPVQRPVPPPFQQQSAFEPQPSAVPGTSTLDNNNQSITPAAQAALQGKLPKGDALPAEMSVNATQATKTPNIDTMAKEYESSFT